MKSMAAIISPVASAPSATFFSAIWRSAAPKKVKIFGWRIAINRVNTADRIQRQNPLRVLSRSCCMVCKRDAKDVQHLFVDCPAAASWWSWFFGKVGIHASSVILLADFFQVHTATRKNARWVAAVKAGVLAGFWAIWLLRNKCIFEDEGWNAEGLQDTSNRLIAMWLHSSEKDFKGYSLADLQRDWASAI